MAQKVLGKGTPGRGDWIDWHRGPKVGAPVLSDEWLGLGLR